MVGTIKEKLMNKFNLREDLSNDDFLYEVARRVCSMENYLGNGIDRMTFFVDEEIVLKINSAFGRRILELSSPEFDYDFLYENNGTTDFSGRNSNLYYNLEKILDAEEVLEELTKTTENDNEQSKYECLSFEEICESDKMHFAQIYGFTSNYGIEIVERCIPYETAESNYDEEYDFDKLQDVKAYLQEELDVSDLHDGNIGFSLCGMPKVLDFGM